MKVATYLILVLAFAFITTPRSSWAQGKIAYVNSAGLAEDLPDIIAANKTFEDFQKQKQAMLEAMASERLKKYELYEEKYRNLSEANRSVLEKELALLEKEVDDLSQRIADTQEKFQEEIEEKQASVYSPIMRKVNMAIQAVAKEKGYSYVFDTSQPGLVYFEVGDDLQALVRTKLGITSNVGQTPLNN